ncbi:MAG: carboxymuconolactone decarboxylase family protein [Haloarculaceae archaeon]
MSRLPLLDIDDVAGQYDSPFTDEFLGDRHIFRGWAQNPAGLEATLEYLEVLYEQLGDRRSELVNLTVARTREARYEWHQHVDIAPGAGVTIDESQAIGGDDISVVDDAESVLRQYARAVESGTVTDQLHDALARAYPNSEIVAIGLLVDLYVGLCNYVAAVDLRFEGGEIVGWTPEQETVRALFGHDS